MILAVFQTAKPMQYHFADLTLDDQRKSLTAGEQQIDITRKGYELLLYLLKNPGRVVAKEELISHVWEGRIVTENTVDQYLSKLRKTLQTHGLENAIESVYGHGVTFTPEVRSESQQTGSSRMPYRNVIVAAAVFLLIMATWLYFDAPPIIGYGSGPENAETAKPLLMIVGTESPTGEESSTPQWQQNPDQLLEQMLKYSDRLDLRLYGEKPPHLNQQTFLQNAWQLNPELNTVMARLSQSDNQFTLSLTLTDGRQNRTEQQFTNDNIGAVIKAGSQWIHAQMALEGNTSIDHLLPENAYVTELYMRGLLAMRRGDIDKAAASFELCVAENPGFHLARLELTHIRTQQGRMEESLALLKTLESAQLLPAFEVEIATLKSNILGVQGEGEAANALLFATIDRYSETHPAALNDLRLALAQRLQSDGDLGRALEQLQIVQQNLDPARKPRLAASAAIARASVLHELGKPEQAEAAAQSALEIYTREQDLIGVARSNSTLGRMLIAQGQRRQAAGYMQRALTIAREMNYSMGIGAAINDVLPLLITLGDLDKAEQLNQEMMQIAADVQFPRMQLVALQHAIEIAIRRNNDTQMQQLLSEHRQLATELNSQRALQQNTVAAFRHTLHLNQKPDDQQIAAIQALLQDAEIEILALQSAWLYGRYQLAFGEQRNGIALLEDILERARSAKMADMATLVAQSLARYRLEQDQPDQAITYLNNIRDLSPPDYPQLLLEARAEYARNAPLKALELAQRAQQSAHALWTPADQKFLSELTAVNQNKSSQ